MAYDKHYIDGAWVTPESSKTIDVLDSTTEEVIASVPAGTKGDVDRAATAARKAFETWSTSSVDERSKFLQRLEEGLLARADELTNSYIREVGAMPLSLAGIVQTGAAIGLLAGFKEALDTVPQEEALGISTIVREPVGVVGCITPWNFPLRQVLCKIGPAIAAGCTVVLKPSEVAPLTAFIVAEVIDECDLPAGVFNLVCGTGEVVGEAIASHPEVDMVSFTGSTRAGKRVAELASQSVKRVTLELGGKSPNVILDDADFRHAVRGGVSNCFFNAGQTCSAWTRMLVPKDKIDEVAAIAKEVAETFTLGPPSEEGTKLGPLVSKAQQERVLSYIKKGVDEGATLVTGDAGAPTEKGYFVSPTVFKDVTNEMTIAQEEIFGPVLSIIGYEDEEDAIRIANATPYGLHAGVWSADTDRAKRVAKRIRAGQVDINGGNYNPSAPFGGYKQSGYGRECGRFGLEEFFVIKSVQI